MQLDRFRPIHDRLPPTPVAYGRESGRFLGPFPSSPYPSITKGAPTTSAADPRPAWMTELNLSFPRSRSIAIVHCSFASSRYLLMRHVMQTRKRITDSLSRHAEPCRVSPSMACDPMPCLHVPHGSQRSRHSVVPTSASCYASSTSIIICCITKVLGPKESIARGAHRSTPQGWLMNQSFDGKGLEEEQACHYSTPWHTLGRAGVQMAWL